MSNRIISAPSLRDIRITDPLFGRYVDIISEKLLPYQWEILNDRVPGAEPSGCIENFRIAAGERPGPRRGVIFCDTDAYKWLETLAYCLEAGRAKELEATADELVDLLARAQAADGYLNTYYMIEHPDQRWTNLAEGHELYGAGHLIEAAVAYYTATGKEKLLKVACRFADLICQVFGEGGHPGCPGHEEVELSLMKLCRVTGARRYADMARHFLAVRGQRPNYLTEELASRKGKLVFPEFADYDDKYAQTHCPPVQQTDAEGHAVRAVYLCSAMADVAGEYNDDELRAACRRLWESITDRRMYITGGIGSSGHLERFTADYDLPNDRMYCESCASVGLMMFGRRMAALTGEAGYCDTVERALCNTILGGISLEGDRYFYVNPLEVWPDNCLPSTSMAHVKPARQPWFATACCPPNIARTLASLGQYTLDASGKNATEADFDPNSIVQFGCNVDNWTWQLEVWALSNGGRWFSADGKQCTINTPEVAESIQKVADLYLVDKVAQYRPGLEDSGIQSTIGAGNVAMATGGAWNVGTCMNGVDFNYGVARLPYMKNEVTICTGGPQVVFAQSQHPDEAMEFIKWYMKEENSWDSLIATGIWMPILEEYYTDETLTHKWVDNANFPDYDEYKAAVVDYAMESAQSTCWYYVPHTTEFIEYLRSILGPVWTGEQTAADALAAGYDTLNSIFLDD